MPSVIGTRSLAIRLSSFSDKTRVDSWTGPVVAFGSASQHRKISFQSDVPARAKSNIALQSRQVVNDNPAITAVGSDTRGTIFAIYTFCEEVLGVDPMYVFTDNQPKRSIRNHAYR